MSYIDTHIYAYIYISPEEDEASPFSSQYFITLCAPHRARPRSREPGLRQTEQGG